MFAALTLVQRRDKNNMWDMNYSQIMSPVPFASKSGGHVPPAPVGAPPIQA